MWYRYFVKESWNIRVFRKANLKFNQDDFGMFSTKVLGRFRDFVFRMSRTEGAMRGCNFFFGFANISILMYLKESYYDEYVTKPKKEQEAKDLLEKDQHAKDTLFFNKFGAPTRPHRSLEDLITFMAGSWTYDQLADSLSYNALQDVNQDMQKGLDSWMGEEDKKMLKYYQKSAGKDVDLTTNKL